MADDDIDEVDEAILYALQTDARDMSSGDIAERAGTSDSTVRKRIKRLEEDGVIKGYTGAARSPSSSGTGRWNWGTSRPSTG
jgi:DNA-binding Lrp family transcriptional regulator